MIKRLTFGKFLTKKRIQSKLSLRETAAKVGMSAAYLSEIEREIKPPPQYNFLCKLCEVLYLSLEEKYLLLDLATNNHSIIAADIPEIVYQWNVLFTNKLAMALRMATAREIDKFVDSVLERKVFDDTKEIGGKVG